MIKQMIGLLLLSFTLSVSAQQESEQIAPLNPDFVNAISSQGAGFIPSPMVYSFDNLPQTRAAISLPAKYDMRDLGILSTPRNQGIANTCWSFATMDALQSVWAKLGQDPGYMSAENIANCHGFDKVKNDGGNAEMALAYLSRFSGPVTEAADPYLNQTTGTCKAITKSDKLAGISQALRLPQNTQIIKQMIYLYGGVFTAFNSAGFSTYYNSSTNCTYSPDGSAGVANHAGTIVGWDDDKLITIPGQSSPSNPGAWIIKNTYGTAVNEAGYYYASYEDYYVGSYTIVYTQRLEKEPIDTVYYYDKLGPITKVGAGRDSAYTLSKFTTPNAQIINNIGFYTASAGASVDVYIYQTKTGELLDGLLASKIGYYCEYPGYYTIPLSALVSGDYYVKIKYKTPGNLSPIPIENAQAGFSSPIIQSVGNQWVKYSEASAWGNVGVGSFNPFRNYNLCVKAFAQNVTEAPSFTISKTKTCGTDTLLFTNTSIGSYANYEWDFGPGANPQFVSTTSKDATKVYYTSAGAKTVKLKAIDGLQQDSLVKYAAVEILDGLALNILSTSGKYAALKNNTLALVVSGADSYVWNLPLEIASFTPKAVNVLVPETGVKVKLTGILGKCTASDSVQILTLANCAAYDDIQEAKSLSLDTQEGPFSNACATWQTNEPVPPATDCLLQNGWCPGQDSLENTLWFKFTAPSTGAVKIVSAGFDNQIALYDAKSTGTYADILSGDPSKYTILAAADDSSSIQAAATIEKITGLSPGKTYWIQMDGSLGGQIGSAYLKVITEIGLSIAQTMDAKYMIVNPVKNDELRILNANDIKEINVLDLLGQNLKRQQFRNQNAISLDVSKLPWGYYLLKIETNQGSFCEKILIE